MNAKLFIASLLCCAGLVAGGLFNHWQVSQYAVASGAYSSTVEVPMTLNSTATGAVVGGIATWIAGIAGLFDKIMAIIGIGQKIKDAVPKSLIDAVAKMIKERKVNFTQLITEFKNVDAALILSLIKDLTALIGGKLVTGPVDPNLMRAEGPDDVPLIEIV